MLFKAPSCHLHVGELLIGDKSVSGIGEDFKEKSFKFLGHHIDENLTWVHHMDHVNKKLVSANYALSRSKSLLPRRILKNIYRSLFESHLHFGSIVWGCTKQSYIKKLEIQQKKAVRHIFNLKFNSHTAEAFRDLEYLQINDLISLNQSIFARNYKNNKLPSSFRDLLSPVSDQGPRRTRDDDYNFSLMPLKYSGLFYYPVPKIISNWNSLPVLSQ